MKSACLFWPYNLFLTNTIHFLLAIWVSLNFVIANFSIHAFFSKDFYLFEVADSAPYLTLKDI